MRNSNVTLNVTLNNDPNELAYETVYILNSPLDGPLQIILIGNISLYNRIDQ